MPRIKSLSDMEIDEISLVDKGANQHATITIAKRAPEEDQMPELYDEEGQLLDENALEDGQIVFDGEGNAYQFSLSEDTEDEVEDKELASVGKSAFFKEKQPETGFSKALMEELSKAFSDDDRDKVIAKAFSKIEELEKSQEENAKIAKAERDLRLTREYIAKAAEYNLPVPADELGPVLYRMAETMSYDDCAVIAKCLESAGDMLFEELGYRGGGDNGDVMTRVQQAANEAVAKAAGSGVATTAAEIQKVFDASPEANDEYLAAQRGL